MKLLKIININFDGEGYGFYNNKPFLEQLLNNCYKLKHLFHNFIKIQSLLKKNIFKYLIFKIDNKIKLNLFINNINCFNLFCLNCFLLEKKIKKNYGKKIIVSKTAIGDIIDYKIIKEQKDFIIGKINKILVVSKDRVKNIACPVYSSCGGCNLLHLSEDFYYDFKNNILKQALKRSKYELNKIDLIKISYNSRRRVSFKVKNQKLGFFEKNSNHLIEINSCPLINYDINDLILYLKLLIQKISIEEISITKYENGVEILLTLTKNLTLNDNEILKNFIEKNNKIIILSYKMNNKEPFLFFQKTIPILTFKNSIKLDLTSNIFLQATEEGQNAITNIIIQHLKNSKNILDLYCGIGTYTFPLSTYSNIYSVEGDQKMVDILNTNIKNNNLNSKIKVSWRDLVNSPLLKEELNKYNGIVINPPRNGAKAQCQQIAKSNIKNIVLVSCNPQTFSSDANELKNGGYELTSLTGIDQFYRTQHIEIVATFIKEI